jgi:hypothetical protein
MKTHAQRDVAGRAAVQRRRAAHASAAAPLQAALDRSARVSTQDGLRAALDRSPRVVADAQRGEALTARAVQRRPAHPGSTPVVQRALNRTGRRAVRGSTTLAGAGGLGYALSGFGLPGVLAGAAVGGLAGYFAPDLVRWARAGNIWDEVNQDDPRHRSWNTPGNLADQLTRDSPRFRALRRDAQREARAVHGRDLSYEAADDNIGGHTAAYGGGVVRIDEEQSSPAVSVQNLVFETANAAQSRFFDTLRADYDNGSMAGKSLREYGDLLGRDPRELGVLAKEYETTTDLRVRRAILQEWAEWNSLELARATFTEIAPRFTSDTAQFWLEQGFGGKLGARDFADYYERFGHAHRASVEHGGWGEKDKDL